MAGKRRDFGRVRQLPSGRWQARYPGPDGTLRPAPMTFERKKDASDWLATKRTEIMEGEWRAPEAGRVPFGVYARTWLDERPNLSPTTYDRYESALRLHLLPTFGKLALSDITEARVRQWRSARLAAGIGAPTVAKSYRLLRAILNTAVDDRLIRRNPCRIKGASDDQAPERPILTVAEVYEVAEVIGPRWRALVLLATFTSLRFGELAALRRRDVDLGTGVIHVRRGQAEARGRLVIKDPKSEAGRRSIAIPAAVLPDLTAHLATYAQAGPDGLVFVGAQGGCLRRHNFRRVWTKAKHDAGVNPEAHFHDLRHTGNTLAAATGASTRELMRRMGHASMRAALIYQHATPERDHLIADGISAQIAAARKPAEGHAASEGARRGHAR